MNTSAQSLIHLDGVTKVFFTDEVETHALAGIHLEIKSGEYIAIAGPSGLRQVDAALDPRAARLADGGQATSSTARRWRTCRCPSGRACAIARSGSSSRAST